MECEPFLPFSGESGLGYRTVSRNTSAAIKDVHVIIFHRFHMLDMQYPWDIGSLTAMYAPALKYSH